nr:MAG TPA: Protein of unknown function (DUF3293) [Caudoviricetes sp.]
MVNENQRNFLVATTDLFFNMTKVDDFESIEEITNDYHEFSVDGKLAILVREEDVYGDNDEMQLFESVWSSINEVYEVQLFRNGKTRCVIAKRSLMTYTPDITELSSVDPKEILASIVGSNNISDTDSGVLDEVEDIVIGAPEDDGDSVKDARSDGMEMLEAFLRNINSISVLLTSDDLIPYAMRALSRASLPAVEVPLEGEDSAVFVFNVGVGELQSMMDTFLGEGKSGVDRFEFSYEKTEYVFHVSVNAVFSGGQTQTETYAVSSINELINTIFVNFIEDSDYLDDVSSMAIELVKTIEARVEPVNENHLFGRATSVGAVKLVESARAKAYLHEYASYCKGWGLQGGKFFSRNILENSRAKKAFKAVMGLDPNINTIVIISPANPAPQVLTRRENDERVARLEWKLRNELKEGGYNYVKVLGKYGSVEPSFVIYNMSYYEAEDLATEFGQESFIFCEFDHSQRGSTRAGKVSARMYMKDENGDYNLDDAFEGILDRNNTQRNLTEFYTQLSKKIKFNIPFGDDGSTISERLSEGFEKYMTDTLIASHLTHSAIVGDKRKKLGNERVNEILEGLRSEDTPNSERKKLRLELYK